VQRTVGGKLQELEAVEIRKDYHRVARPDFSIMRWGKQGEHPTQRDGEQDGSRADSTSRADGLLADSKVRRVTFAPQYYEERFYHKDRPSCRLLARASILGSSTERRASSDYQSYSKNLAIEPDPAVDEDRPLRELVKAIHSDSYREVLRLLARGVIRTEALIDGEEWLTREYAYVKKNADTKKDKFDRVLKILKVYQTAHAAINIALSLKSWCHYRLEIRKITNLKLSAKGLQQTIKFTSFKGAVFLRIGKKSEKLESLPPMDIGNEVDYSAGGIAAVPTYHLYNNPNVNESRELVIEVHSGIAGVPFFAALTLPLKQLSAQCSQIGQSIDLIMDLIPNEEGFVEKGAKVHIRAERAEVDPAYTAKKKKIGLDQMKNYLDWTERFNGEHCSLNSPKLTARIYGPKSFSLLHAAVIFEDPHHAQRLLSLGADPYTRSEQGSALTYALSVRVSMITIVVSPRFLSFLLTFTWNTALPLILFCLGPCIRKAPEMHCHKQGRKGFQ
jgi:hypothetical protein